MSFIQLVMPDPFIPCTPGWCLQYVRQAFGAPIVEPTATKGWENAVFKHTGMDFPSGVWVPVWFAVAGVPEGHVVLRAPDGSIYSTTSPTNTRATVHPTLDDLFAAYAPYNPLTYRGWTEDVSNVRVVQEMIINVESVDEEMVDVGAIAAETAKQIMNYNLDRKGGSMGGQLNLAAFLSWSDAAFESLHKENATLRELVSQLAIKQGVTIDYDAIAQAVNNDAAKRLAQ